MIPVGFRETGRGLKRKSKPGATHRPDSILI